MPGEWFNPCGVAYRLWEDGRIEVQNAGFPAWTDSTRSKQISDMWQRWGEHIEKAALSVGAPTAWIAAIMYIESGGKPTVCSSAGACGLMQFMPMTCRMYGKECSYYNEHPEQNIYDGAHLLVKYHMPRKKGCLLSSVKAYNGGSPCGETVLYSAGPGMLNMWGERGYVEKFVYAANTFVSLNLSSQLGQDGSGSTTPPATAAIVVAGVAGVVAYMFADIKWGLTDRLLASLGDAGSPAFRSNGADESRAREIWDACTGEDQAFLCSYFHEGGSWTWSKSGVFRKPSSRVLQLLKERCRTGPRWHGMTRYRGPIRAQRW